MHVCVCVCTSLLVSPHLQFWSPFTNVSYLWDKDRGLKAHICVDMWQHGVTCPGCPALLWELAGASYSSSVTPAASVPTRGDQAVGWRVGEGVPDLPLV